jgi:hypothetical protein
MPRGVHTFVKILVRDIIFSNIGLYSIFKRIVLTYLQNLQIKITYFSIHRSFSTQIYSTQVQYLHTARRVGVLITAVSRYGSITAVLLGLACMYTTVLAYTYMYVMHTYTDVAPRSCMLRGAAAARHACDARTQGIDTTRRNAGYIPQPCTHDRAVEHRAAHCCGSAAGRAVHPPADGYNII